MKLDGKVVVITGASSGIGEALAVELVKRGAKVVVSARRADKLEALVSRLGPSALAVAADVTVRDQVQRILDEAVAKLGRVDVWVNNAGRGISRPFMELTDEDVDAMITANTKSVLYGTQIALRHFMARGDGAVVNVSSMLSRAPFAPIRSAYSASKAAMNSLTETARMEVAKSHPGIRVQLVLPGVVATEFGNNALGGGMDSRSIPGGQTAEEVAKVIAEGIESGRPDVYTRPDGMEPVLQYLRSLVK